MPTDDVPSVLGAAMTGYSHSAANVGAGSITDTDAPDTRHLLRCALNLTFTPRVRDPRHCIERL